MKKLVTAVVSFALVGAVMLSSVHAENEPSKTTTLSYDQSSKYTLTIPNALPLNGTQTTEFNLTVGTDINLTPTQELVIRCSSSSIDSSGNVTMTRTIGGETKKVKVSTTKTGGGIDTSTKLAVFKNQTSDPSSGGTIYFAPVDNVKSGTYTGSIIFTASLEATTSN